MFDESQKESNNEIWIDVGAITSVVEQNQSEVVRNNETKEFTRKYKFWLIMICKQVQQDRRFGNCWQY